MTAASIRRQPRTTLLIGTLSLALLLAIFIGYPYMTAFDQGINALVQEHRSSAMDTAAVLVTQIGNFRTQFLAAALICVILLFTRQWRAMWFFGGVTLVTALTVQNTVNVRDFRVLDREWVLAQADAVSNPTTPITPQNATHTHGLHGISAISSNGVVLAQSA